MIFLDSSYFVGLMVPKDNWNEKAKNIIIPKDKYMINNIILSEVLNIVSKRTKKDIPSVCSEIFNRSDIIWLTTEDYKYATSMCKYYNNAINYNDCLILISMMKLSANKIVSFDSGLTKIKGIKVIS